MSECKCYYCKNKVKFTKAENCDRHPDADWDFVKCWYCNKLFVYNYEDGDIYSVPNLVDSTAVV